MLKCLEWKLKTLSYVKKQHFTVWFYLMPQCSGPGSVEQTVCPQAPDVGWSTQWRDGKPLHTAPGLTPEKLQRKGCNWRIEHFDCCLIQLFKRFFACVQGWYTLLSVMQADRVFNIVTESWHDNKLVAAAVAWRTSARERVSRPPEAEKVSWTQAATRQSAF